MTKCTVKAMALTLSLTASTLVAQVATAQTATAASTTSTVASAPAKSMTSLSGRSSLGLRPGYVNTSGDQRDTMNLGLEFESRLNPMLGVALEVGGYSTPRLVNTASLSRLELLAKASFHPVMGNIPVVKYLRIGAGVGPVYDHIASLRRVSAAFVPELGIDVPVAQFGDAESQFTVGAAATGYVLAGDAPDAFSFSGVAKYWF